MTTRNHSLTSVISGLFNTGILGKSRWPWVDYLKGIAIVLVVYRHVLIGIQRNGMVVPEPLVNANMVFFSFRMPLFFILSGLFISSSFAKKPLNQLVQHKFNTILYPYLIWATIQISLQILLGGSTNSNRGLIDYAYILYQPRALDQFWYLPALFNATLVFLLLKKYFSVKTGGHLLLGIILYFAAPYFDKISMLSDWMEFYVFFALGDALSTFFFQPRTQQRLRHPLSTIVLLPFFIAAQVYYLSRTTNQFEFLVISLTGCLFMFALAFLLEKWNRLKFLRILGYHSLQIYVMHVICSAFVRTILTKVFHLHQPVILLFTGIAFGVVLPVICYNLFMKDGFAWFLFSPRKPLKKNITSDKIVLKKA